MWAFNTSSSITYLQSIHLSYLQLDTLTYLTVSACVPNSTSAVIISISISASTAILTSVCWTIILIWKRLECTTKLGHRGEKFHNDLRKNNMWLSLPVLAILGVAGINTPLKQDVRKVWKVLHWGVAHLHHINTTHAPNDTLTKVLTVEHTKKSMYS